MNKRISHTVTQCDVDHIASAELDWCGSYGNRVCRFVEDLAGGENYQDPRDPRHNELCDRVSPKWGNVEVKTTHTETVTLGNKVHVIQQTSVVDHLFVYRWKSHSAAQLNAKPLVPGDVLELELVSVTPFNQVALRAIGSVKGNKLGCFVFLSDAAAWDNKESIEAFNLMEFDNAN